jgi:septal ring-binding cell division protein DamX
MAAYQQKNYDEARARLAVAETSDDKQVAGQAKFVMGSVLSDQRAYEAAAAKYDEAAGMLTGEEATRARGLAEAARAEAKPAPTQVASAGDDGDDAPAAKGKTTKSDAKSGSKSGKSGKSDAKSGGKDKDDDKGKASDSKSKAKSDGDAKKGFTIQCGAYAKESDARKRAKDLADDAKKAGLPAPEVKRQTGRDGKKLWVVTIGSFKSRADGKKALAKLKVDHAEVLPITG